MSTASPVAVTLHHLPVPLPSPAHERMIQSSGESTETDSIAFGDRRMFVPLLLLQIDWLERQLLQLLTDLDCDCAPAFVRRIEHIPDEPVALRPCFEAADLDLGARAVSSGRGRGSRMRSGAGGPVFLYAHAESEG